MKLFKIMHAKIAICFVWNLLFLSLASAQKPEAAPRVFLNDPGEVFSTFDFSENSTARTALLRVMPPEQVEKIAARSHERAWPLGIATLEKRLQNREAMTAYVFYRVASFQDERQTFDILFAPKNENEHMPFMMQPIDNEGFYMVVSSAGINSEVGEVLVKTSQTQAEKKYARLLDPGQLFSTFDLLEDKNAVAHFSKSLTPEEINFLAKLVVETAWPEGIASFEARQRNRNLLKDYKFTHLGNFTNDDGVEMTLLYVSFEDNLHMPDPLLPTTSDGFFMLFSAIGVAPE